MGMSVLVLVLAALVWPIAHTYDHSGVGSSISARALLRGRQPRRDVRWMAQLCQLTAMGLRAGLPASGALRAGLSAAPPDGVVQEELAARLARDHLPQAAAWAAPVAGEAAEVARARQQVARAWRIADEVGAPLAPALSDIAESLEEAVAAHEQVHAASAGARSTMKLLTGLPLLGLAGVLLSGQSLGEVYLQSPVTMLALVAGLALTALGWACAHWILARALR